MSSLELGHNFFFYATLANKFNKSGPRLHPWKTELIKRLERHHSWNYKTNKAERLRVSSLKASTDNSWGLSRKQGKQRQAGPHSFFWKSQKEGTSLTQVSPNTLQPPPVHYNSLHHTTLLYWSTAWCMQMQLHSFFPSDMLLYIKIFLMLLTASYYLRTRTEY